MHKTFYPFVFSAARLLLCIVFALCATAVHVIALHTAHMYVAAALVTEAALCALFVWRGAARAVCILVCAPFFALESGALALLVARAKHLPRTDFIACALITAVTVCATGVFSAVFARASKKS